MQKYLLLIALIGLCTPFFAQKAAQADQLFSNGQYEKAYTMYLSLYKASPKNQLYCYRLARCEQETGKVEAAISHFLEAGDRYPLKHFYLGELYLCTYRFAEARESYSRYLDIIPETHERYQATEQQMRLAEKAEHFIARVEDIAVVDTVHFPLQDLAQYLPLSKEQGTIEITDQYSVFTNQRGDRRFFSVVDSLSQRTLLCSQQRLLEDWSAPDTLPAAVNKFYKQAYPFLMPDGLTLYFAAQSENGLGGWDMYMTKYNPATGTYLTPEMLGMPFNSFDDDMLFYIDEHANLGYFFSNRNVGLSEMMRYTFIPSDTKRILRDSTETFRREFAQLHILRAVPSTDEKIDREPELEVAPITVAPVEAEPSWRIVINDSLVYTSLDAFKGEEARSTAEQYLDVMEQIEEETADLQKNRQQYEAAEDSSEKHALKPLILTLEKDIIRLRREADKLLKNLRVLELQ